MSMAGRRTRYVAVIGGVLFATLAIVDAGAETVTFPAGYRTAFVEYGVVDAPAVKRVRTFYVAPEVLRAVAPGRALPDGTVLVMEVRDAKLDAEGQPVRDAAGRFVPGDRVVGLWVQAKANGAWGYARFDADGSRVSGEPLDRCIACHTTRPDQDFTYLFWRYVATIKKP
jgi:Cytochrome P460